MTCGALLFDFDGLLVDSETPLFDIWHEIYERHGARLTIDDWQHALGTQGGFDPFATLEKRRHHRGHLPPRDELAAYVRARHWELCESQPLLPGVVDRLADAEALGLPSAVASSSGLDWVGPWLDRHGLRARFAAVCTREDVGRVKPAPDLFLLAAARLGVPPAACVVFEDSPNGLRAARAAGMRAVAVPNGLTRGLAMPPVDLVLSSLAERPLAGILAALDAAPASSS